MLVYCECSECGVITYHCLMHTTVCSEMLASNIRHRSELDLDGIWPVVITKLILMNVAASHGAHEIVSNQTI